MSKPAKSKTPASPTTYVAFLRGINVGGHTIKMDDLARSRGLAFRTSKRSSPAAILSLKQGNPTARRTREKSRKNSQKP